MCAAIEERFAQRLASNDLPTRNKALKRLNKWIAARSAVEDAFTELELLKLWKGLHVCMWHSDKPLVQEELADNISKLVHVFHTPDTALDFIEVFFTTVAREWLGIDRLRLDKYYMLIRKVLFHCFTLLQNYGWNDSLVERFAELMTSGPLSHNLTQTCLGVQLHVLEVYLPELMKSDVTGCPGNDVLEPCLKLLAYSKEPTVVECVCVNVLDVLRDQEVGKKLNMEYGVLSQQLRVLAIDRNSVGRTRKTIYIYCKRFDCDSKESSPHEVTTNRKKRKKRRVLEDDSKESPPHEVTTKRKKRKKRRVLEDDSKESTPQENGKRKKRKQKEHNDSEQGPKKKRKKRLP